MLLTRNFVLLPHSYQHQKLLYEKTKTEENIVIIFSSLGNTHNLEHLHYTHVIDNLPGVWMGLVVVAYTNIASVFTGGSGEI